MSQESVRIACHFLQGSTTYKRWHAIRSSHNFNITLWLFLSRVQYWTKTSAILPCPYFNISTYDYKLLTMIYVIILGISSYTDPPPDHYNNNILIYLLYSRSYYEWRRTSLFPTREQDDVTPPPPQTPPPLPRVHAETETNQHAFATGSCYTHQSPTAYRTR